MAITAKKRILEVLATGHYASDLDPDHDQPYDAELEGLVRHMLMRLGEDPDRKGLIDTPQRVAKTLDFLTSGYQQSVEEVVNGVLFEDQCEEMVIVKDIEFYSLCEHHLLPFFGHAHVGYIPNGKVIGLSKIARIVDIYARRLQVQENLTQQIANALMTVLGAHGVAVVMEATHFCMVMRGVQKQNSRTITSSMLGTFREDSRTRAEFMGLVKGSKA